MRRNLMLVMLLAISAPAGAVDVRQGDEPLFVGNMRRAYQPCLAPNAVTDRGVPACFPAVTSICRLGTGRAEISGATLSLDLRRPFASQPPECTTGSYHVEVGIRSTFDKETQEVSCNGATCTVPDETVALVPFDFENNPTRVSFGLSAGIARENLEIRGIRLIGPDGLPVASLGTGSPSTLDTEHQNLSVGYEACVTAPPGFESCEAAWASPCDFTSGTIVPQAGVLPSFKTTLHGLAGSSPLCTTGTYQLEARVRVTVNACGPSEGDRACTLPDTTQMMPFLADGPELVRTTGFNPADTPTVELLGLRLFDPTGALFAAAASTSVQPLTTPTVTMKDDRLQVRAVFPPGGAFDEIDPAEDDGVTLSLRDKNGAVYAVTIPGSLWQLQPPLGERWDYRDLGGIIGGVRKARVKLLRKQGVPVGYDIRLDARGVDLSGADGAGVTLTIGIARRVSAVLDGLKEAESYRSCRTRGSKKQCR